MKPLYIAAALTLFIASCSEPTIDISHDSSSTRSPDTFAQTKSPPTSPTDSIAPDTVLPDSSIHQLDPNTSPTLMRTSNVIALRETSQGYEAIIPYTYTNSTNDSVYLTNCNGNVSPSVQILSGSKWIDWWAPIMNECLSRPVVIAPGSTYTDSLRIGLSPQDGAAYKQLQSAKSTQAYRLNWQQALQSFDASKYPFGKQLPLERRVSNAFMFTR